MAAVFITNLLKLARKKVAFENPGYNDVRKIFQKLGCKLSPISIESDGLSIKEVKDSMAQAVYVTPSHQLSSVLKEKGLEPHIFEDMTGLYVDIGRGIPKVGFRTDIDALWQEVDGQFKANHSCGHDGHMTMALGAALQLHEQKKALPGAVRIIFQPAEEKAQGAKAMVEKGVDRNSLLNSKNVVSKKFFCLFLMA